MLPWTIACSLNLWLVKHNQSTISGYSHCQAWQGCHCILALWKSEVNEDALDFGKDVVDWRRNSDGLNSQKNCWLSKHSKEWLLLCEIDQQQVQHRGMMGPKMRRWTRPIDLRSIECQYYRPCCGRKNPCDVFVVLGRGMRWQTFQCCHVLAVAMRESKSASGWSDPALY